jgi:hypothetical protein
MLSPQQLHQMQERHYEQQADGPITNAALFANSNSSAGLKQQQRINSRFQGMMGQDVPFGQAPQLPMGLRSFQANPPYAPDTEQPLSAPEGGEEKRKSCEKGGNEQAPLEKPTKKARTDDDAPSSQAPPVDMVLKLDFEDGTAPAPVEASKQGTTEIEDNDVLSGRGGGTNVHPGNRNFRDLINLYRRSYLKARKNDKPSISRAIVRAIRESGGRFLKKGSKSDLWFEIGDDAAREKASQALRQRAPEMRKLLFDSEEEARVVTEDQIRRQGMLVGNTPLNNNAPGNGMMWGEQDSGSPGMMNPTLLQAMAANSKLGNGQDGTHYQFSSMFSAALLQKGMNRFASNGA